MFTYHCVEQNEKTSELGTYTTYSLNAYQTTETGDELLASFPDVSPDRALVEALAQQCTALQLDPCHLNDVVEDAVV